MVKISVLMPTYNDEKYVEDSISSLLNQSHNDWELIIVDGSTDRTSEIERGFAARDPRIKYVREQGSGQLRALLYGSQFVRGEYLTLLHSDDELSDSEALKRNALALEKNKCDGLFCDMISMNEKGEQTGIVRAANQIDESSLATLFLRGGSNFIPDFFFVTRRAFDNVISSYMTWGIQYWIRFVDNQIGTLNLRKAAPWYRYRLYSENYGYSESGKFELSTGGLRTILEIGTRISIPFLDLQKLLVRVFKERITPVFKWKPSSPKQLRDMVFYVIDSRYKVIPKNPYFKGITGFYLNFPSKRTIQLDIRESKVFVGTDTHLFFKLLEKSALPPIYETILREAQQGFGKVVVKSMQDCEKAKRMMRFLNLLTEIEIE